MNICCLLLRLPDSLCRFFLKRAPFAAPGGELKVEAVRPAYQVSSLAVAAFFCLSPADVCMLATSCHQPHRHICHASHGAPALPVQILDAFHHGSVDGHPSVTSIIAESKQLQEFQDLFEMYVSDYLVLTRCSEELLYLKSLWDMVGGGVMGCGR